MKRIYIFLTTLIRGIGGGHIYTLNKIHFLEKRGYATQFIHANVLQGIINITELAIYENNYDEALQYPCYAFSKKRQKEVLNKLLSMIPLGYDEYIIESQTIPCSTWGELLAAKLPKGKNFVYLLGEHIKIENTRMYEFFRFKLERKELVGIDTLSLKSLFSAWYKIGQNQNYSLPAYCTNVLSKEYYPQLSLIPQSDYTIGFVGRIDKLFVMKSLCDILRFVTVHSDKTFTLLFIGGSTNKKAENKIRKYFKDITNVKIYITGLLFPIPVDLVQKGDVYLSTAGSCKISQELGKVTISHDGHDAMPIGLFRITTQHSLFRDKSEKPLDLIELLDSILIKKQYVNQNVDIDAVLSKYDFDYSSHMDFLESSSKELKYFDIASASMSWQEHIKYDGAVLLGIQMNNKLFNIISLPYRLKMRFFKK